MSSMAYSVVIMLSLVVAIGVSVILSHAVQLLDVMLHIPLWPAKWPNNKSGFLSDDYFYQANLRDKF